MAAKRWKEGSIDRMHIPLLRMMCWCNIVLVSTALMMTDASAEHDDMVQRISLSELNQMMAQKKDACLVAFMAAWCGPCREELPILNQLYKRFHGKGFRIIGVSIDVGGPAALERILKKKQVRFPVFWVGEKAVDEFNLVGIPMTYFIKNGQIVEKIPGKCSYEFLRGRIVDIIK